MDAPTIPFPATEFRCDVCGYPRNGLPAQALCPECGEPPPRLAQHEPIHVGAVTAAPMTAARLAHLHTLTIGLFLLISSSITAIGVTLIMPIGPLSVAAMNVPAPKIHAAAMVQRNIGGPPGAWGIAGTTAALCGVIALWILTTPQSLRADEEPTWSLRRAARWVGVLTAGGALGALLTASEYTAPQGAFTAILLAMALLLCELPANALLYAHLRQVAIDVGDRRAAATLERCVWLMPIATALAGAMVLYGMLRAQHNEGLLWPAAARVAMVIYGAGAVAIGAAATAGILRLLATCSGLTLAAWLPAASGAVARMSGAIGVVLRSIRQTPRRWAIVAGLSIWLYAFASFAMFGLAYPGRYFGETPVLEFIGPRVPAAALAGDAALRYNSRIPQNELFRLCLINLLAIWLMTWPSGSPPRARLATAARWTAILLAGTMFGLGLWGSVQNGRTFGRPRLVAALIAPADAVATILIYLHLASIAATAGRRDLARALRWRGCAGILIGLLPLAFFIYSPANRTHPPGKWMLVASMSQGAAAFAITFLCAAALARLAWTLATQEAAQPAIDTVETPVKPLANPDLPPRPVLTLHLPETRVPQPS
jgi:hypothetical protein